MSTYTQASDIIFPESRGRSAFGIKRISSVHTEKSWQEFTSIAEIVIPRNARDFSKIETEKLFELGDPVIIKFGYGAGEIPIEFEGYITDISDGIPYRLKCEDEMFNLKRGSISISKKNVTLKQLLETIAPDYEIECPDISLGTVRHSNVAPIVVLEKLKKGLDIYSYFVGKVLHAVDGNSPNGATIQISLEKDVVSEDLNRKSDADEKLLIKFKSLQHSGRYIIHEEGDKDGTVKELEWPHLTKAEIETRVKRMIELRKAKGLEGTITLFGTPQVCIGAKAEIKSLFYKDMDGLYYIDKIVKDFDKNGIRQVLTLGNKAR